MFKTKLLPIAVSIALATSSPITCAIGVGNNLTKGTINRPLNLELPLLAESFELNDLRTNLADYEQHDKVGISYPSWMPKLKFETLSTPNGPILKITTSQPIKEPIVNFLLEIKYRETVLYKEITLFLDPIETINSDLINSGQIKSRGDLNNVNFSASLSNTRQQPTQNNTTDLSSNSFRVERGQNLWSIAKNWHVDNANLSQKMQAIFLSNPSAFINGDKNKLKQGSLITLSVDSLKINVAPTNFSNTTQTVANASNNMADTVEQKPIKTQLTQDNSTINLSNAAAKGQPDNLATTASMLAEKEQSELNKTLPEQEKLNASLKAEIDRLEKQIALKAQLILAQNKTDQTFKKSVASSGIKPKAAVKSKVTIPITEHPISLTDDNLSASNSNDKKESAPINLWLTAIWFGLAIILAYLGTILSGKRNAKNFARKLDNKLQDLAYNKQKQMSQTPSIKELSIPKNLPTSTQIKYLNSAADFYIRCHRHDLAKELVNEGLLQFKGNTQIIDTLNQIRNRIFNHLDNDIHAHIVEKLDARGEKKNARDVTENMIDIDDFNSEWLKKWDKKVS